MLIIHDLYGYLSLHNFNSIVFSLWRMFKHSIHTFFFLNLATTSAILLITKIIQSLGGGLTLPLVTTNNTFHLQSRSFEIAHFYPA